MWQRINKFCCFGFLLFGNHCFNRKLFINIDMIWYSIQFDETIVACQFSIWHKKLLKIYIPRYRPFRGPFRSRSIYRASRLLICPVLVNILQSVRYVYITWIGDEITTTRSDLCHCLHQSWSPKRSPVQ